MCIGLMTIGYNADIHMYQNISITGQMYNINRGKQLNESMNI